MWFDQGIDIPEALNSDALKVEFMLERARFNLRVKAKDVTAFKKACGLKLPTKIGQTTKASHLLISKFGPDEWVISDTPKNAGKLAKKFEKLADKFVISAVDISHRNVGFMISGKMAVQAVNVGCPLDLSLNAFRIGRATRTIFENAPIQLYRAGASELHIECWRSFAPYLRDFMVAFARDL